MAPYLIPFSPPRIEALYDTKFKLLIVTLKGEIDGFWLGASLSRDDHFVGGLKFLFEGYPGGLGEKPKQLIELKYELHINLPLDHFNSKSVLVETGTATYTVEIHYTGLGPKTSSDVAAVGTASVEDDVINKLNNLRISSVLPPIKKYLPGDAELTISARVPLETPSSVDIRFDPEFLEIVSSGIVNGEIVWALKWVKFPTKDDSPQLVDVDTIRGIPLPESNPITASKVIQGYIVYAVVL